jgi:NADH-quinone oxidoreductase subunit H
MLELLFNYLIFPGLCFSACVGLISCWLDRKISARLQYRVGPPWHQNFTDIIKLLGKETIIPRGAGRGFLPFPAAGLFSAGLAATFLGKGIFFPAAGFRTDLIVVIYLLMLPAVFLMLGASASANPLASVGASREMKMILAYELPFILAVITVIIKNAGAISLDAVIGHQLSSGVNIASLSGALAFLAALICSQAKLGLVPFDASEAEQEIMAGVLIEYSGLGLALFKLTKAVLFYTLPVLLAVLFLGKDLGLPLLALKYLAILTVFILIKNTNPRMRVDQAMKFFWGPVAVVAAAAVLLALFGL